MEVRVEKNTKFTPVTVTLVLNSEEDLVKLYAAACLLVKDAFLPTGFTQEQKLGLADELLSGPLRDILEDMIEDTVGYNDAYWEKGGRKPTKSKKG